MSAVVARVVDVLELVHGMYPILFRSLGGMVTMPMSIAAAAWRV
jgi:hypothetical protein